MNQIKKCLNLVNDYGYFCQFIDIVILSFTSDIFQVQYVMCVFVIINGWCLTMALF